MENPKPKPEVRRRPGTRLEDTCAEKIIQAVSAGYELDRDEENRVSDASIAMKLRNNVVFINMRLLYEAGNEEPAQSITYIEVRQPNNRSLFVIDSTGTFYDNSGITPVPADPWVEGVLTNMVMNAELVNTSKPS